MTKKIELLAPGGDLDSIKAAIAAGADAVYCGLNRFNARNRAANITFEELDEVIGLAHAHTCQVFLTLNIIIVESEIPAFVGLLNKIVNTGIDGIILQDLGMIYLVSTHFKSLKIHASTQLTTHNAGQINFLSRLDVTRVNLSRELSLGEIRELAEIGHDKDILTEVFVHGSNCISFSGLCYMSSVFDGKSGNRGRCSQPCRDKYLPTLEGNSFPLNLKDNSAYTVLAELVDAGVDSIKVEGRIKKFHYVYTIVKSFKEQLQSLYNNKPLSKDMSVLHSVFNRDFTNAFLQGDINKSMFIDNPRDNSAIHRSELDGGLTDENIDKAKRDIYDERTAIIQTVKNTIASLRINKIPITLRFSGDNGSPLKLSVETPTTSFAVFSKSVLERLDAPFMPGNEPLSNTDTKLFFTDLDHKSLLEHLNPPTITGYYINSIELDKLENDLSLCIEDLTALKKQVLFRLNGSKKTIPHIEVPRVTRHDAPKIKPTLAVLISSEKDFELLGSAAADLYYQLPNYVGKDYSSLVEIFRKNTNLTPWFPSIIIGENYKTAVNILSEVHPNRIVTNNTGIACEASKLGIPWIAGPYLNTANSFSLLCLQNFPHCTGAFISNELNRFQVKTIKKPENFDLYYSIYHPILLMKSRQCLFHQVIGCTKYSMDMECLENCTQTASITRLNDTPLYLDKSAGNLNCIYNPVNYLNTDAVTDSPNNFSSFLIDLRNIKTQTALKRDKLSVLKAFENLLAGECGSKSELSEMIQPHTNAQYVKGI